MWKDFELRTPRMTSQSVKSVRNHQFSFTTNPVQLSPLDSLTQKDGTWTNEQRVSNLATHISVSFFREKKKNQVQVDASSSKSTQMPSYSSRNKGLNSKTHPLALLLIFAFKSGDDTWGERWQPTPRNPCGHMGHSITLHSYTPDHHRGQWAELSPGLLWWAWSGIISHQNTSRDSSAPMESAVRRRRWQKEPYPHHSWRELTAGFRGDPDSQSV